MVWGFYGPCHIVTVDESVPTQLLSHYAPGGEGETGTLPSALHPVPEQ